VARRAAVLDEISVPAPLEINLPVIARLLRAASVIILL
jgi:hypothetical protein